MFDQHFLARNPTVSAQNSHNPAPLFFFFIVIIPTLIILLVSLKSSAYYFENYCALL